MVGFILVPDVVTLGEMMAVFVAEQLGALREVTTFRRFVAGAEGNVAVGLSRLGCSAGMITRVGDDEFGRAIVFRLRGEGVDTSHVVVDTEAPTGLMFRERREVGSTNVAYYRRGSAASRLQPADLDPDYIGGARYLHMSGITPAISESARETVFAAAAIARKANVAVVLDPNMRFKLWTPDQAREVLLALTRGVDILLPGADEAELLTGEGEPLAAARRLVGLGPRLVVVKLGSEGALAVTADEATPVPAMALPKVVDPVGAGDGFAAGFLAGQLKGLDLVESLALANRAGALATTVPSDLEGLPRWDEVGEAGSARDVLR
jgi:2-dehydro-3-deoxygluconokinase